ncbi:hypothetical protein G7296_005115 [Salmonella enterica]|nr:hypothetical protein [Salmonella enterica]
MNPGETGRLAMSTAMQWRWAVQPVNVDVELKFQNLKNVHNVLAPFCQQTLMMNLNIYFKGDSS